MGGGVLAALVDSRDGVLGFAGRFCCVGGVAAQVLVDGFAAEPVVGGELGLRGAGRRAGGQFGDLLRCQGALAPLVGATPLGQGDALALAFSDQGAFELGEGSMTESIRVAAGESSPVKTRCSSRNSTRTPLSMNTRSWARPPNWRCSFWSRVLTRTYPIRWPAAGAFPPEIVRVTCRTLG